MTLTGLHPKIRVLQILLQGASPNLFLIKKWWQRANPKDWQFILGTKATFIFKTCHRKVNCIITYYICGTNDKLMINKPNENVNVTLSNVLVIYFMSILQVKIV
jgi:hypothetical protein